MIYEIKYKIFLDDNTEVIITLQADCELDAYSKIKNIVSEQYPGAEYERIYDDEE